MAQPFYGGAEEPATTPKLTTLGSLKWQFYDPSAVTNYPNESAQVAEAIKQAINNFNTVAAYSGTVGVTYVSWGGVTAQATWRDYGGAIQFGYTRSGRAAQHELAHWMGMFATAYGTKSSWRDLCNGGWRGAVALARMKTFKPADGIGCSADVAHFWDYGLNQENEYNWQSKGRNVAMVGAMRADMGLSDGSTLPDAPYRIVSRATGTSVADKSGVELGEVIEARSTVSQKQIWTLSLNGGFVNLKNKASNRYLDVSGANAVMVTSGTPTSSQTWEMMPTTDGYFMLRNRQTDRCLKSVSSTTAGASLQVAACDTNPWSPDTAFQFHLAMAPGFGVWSFNEGQGTTAADGSGSGNPVILRNATWTAGKVGQAVQFGGNAAQSAHGSTYGAILDTSQSFSVSSWVRLDTLTGWRSMVSQDGQNVSGFWLQYGEGAGRKFVLNMNSSDSASSTMYRAIGTTTPVAGQWYHVVGVRDKSAGTMRLYVNGKLEATTAYAGSWQASGPFIIGRNKWGGVPSDWFAGAIDEVRAYEAALTDADVARLYEQSGGGNVITNIAPNAKLGTSHVSPWETLGAVNNNVAPSNSADRSTGAYGNWRGDAAYGQTDWVTFTWPTAKTLSALEVYWWNDGLGIGTPNQSYLEYWNGSAWVGLGSPGLALNTFNRLDFAPVKTTSIRLSMKGALSTGILEARVFGY